MAIIYTLTDEAPLLATYSLLPIIQTYANQAGVTVETRDISLAGRILAAFPDSLRADQRVPDALAELGQAAALDNGANIIKLPNISASVPQLLAAIAELQGQGFAVPDYPLAPATESEQAVRAKYDEVKGSAVNPVLRQGNSDRRSPASVKAYARRHPHQMGAWAVDSPTAVATMSDGDFRHNEASMVVDADDVFVLRFVPDGAEAGGARGVGAAGVGATVSTTAGAADSGTSGPILINDGLAVGAGDVFDATFMSARQLDAFLADQVARAKAENLLFSMQLKATMMKVSDPVIFGHGVRALLPNFFGQHGAELAAAGLTANDGLGSIITGLAKLPTGSDLLADLQAELAAGPELAMVDSDKGITGLHVPSDVIIDASMPAMIRAGGKMWGPDGLEHDVLAVIPDSTYAGVYQAAIDDSRERGALDPATIGSVANVGLMAMAAEEYGSHANTFVAPSAGRVEVVASSGEVLISQQVEAGDIWRACLTRAAAIADWVRLGVQRGRLTGEPIVFWLDTFRPHDAVLLTKVEQTLFQMDADALADVDIHVMAPAEACAYTLARMRAGLNTISVTGNVLRDYLTDLFPILELGTSAKMLSVVPLMAGGGLFETGAGGTAPKHMQQLVAANHMRWDSLGEFLALAASFEHLARVTDNPRAQVLAQTLDQATEEFLNQNRSPERAVGGLDNRGSHFYLAKYWAGALAAQIDDAELAATFAPLATRLDRDETAIVAELAAIQGQPTDLGGYYRPVPKLAAAAMRPSPTFNDALAELAEIPDNQ